MDMSSLHNHLPPSGTAAAHKRQHSPQPPTALTDDFKSAALAVTRLYQNSARQIDNARQEGYLSAVQEVAQLLSSGEFAGDRLREWCAVGLSRITARQDEENRMRPHQQQQQPPQQDERRRQEERRQEEEPQQQQQPEETSSINPVGTNGMPFSPAMPNIFGDTEFTFQSPSPGVMMSGYASPFTATTGARFEPEVTYELVDAGREGRKRGVATQQQGGSIWDVTGMGSKRSRHL
jgi:hypothetical protein